MSVEQTQDSGDERNEIMALLDVFKIGFESDNLKDFEAELKKNEKELDETENKVKDLEGALKDLEKQGLKDSDVFKSVEKDLKNAKLQADNLTNAIEKMRGQSEYQLSKVKGNFTNFLKNTAKIATVAVAVKKSMQFYEQAEQLDFLAQKSGVAVEAIQRLGNAVQTYGGTLEGAGGTLETLRTHRTDIKKGKASEGVKKYGYLFADNPEQTLENIAARMEKMRTDAEKWDLANSLGIDEATTRLLIQGVEKYREELKRAEKYKLYTKEDIEQMRDYRQLQNDIRMGIQRIQAVIAASLLPAFTKIAKAVKKVTDFFAQNREFTRAIGVMGAFVLGLTAVNTALGAVNKALKLAGGLIGVIKGLGLVLLLTTIFYVVTDFIGFLEGKDSVIGDIWRAWGYNLEEIRDGFKNWANEIARIWNNLLAVFDKNRPHIEKEFDLKKQTVGRELLTDDEQKKADAYFLSREKEIKQNYIKKYNEFHDPRNGNNLNNYAFTSSREYIEMENLEKALKAQKAMKKAMKKGRMTIDDYNNNDMNAVPAGAASVLNQTRAINTNNNNNVTNIDNARSRQTVNNIGTINIQTQATDGRGIYNDLIGAANYYDDGMAI